MNELLTYSELKKYKYVISVNEINCTYIDELILPSKFFKHSIYKINTYYDYSVVAGLYDSIRLINIRKEKDGIYGYHFGRGTDGKKYVDKYQFFKSLKEAKINQAISVVLNFSKLVEMYQEQVNKIYT